MTGNKKIYTGEDLPNLELRTDTLLGWSVPSLSRSGVEPPTGIVADRQRRAGLNSTPTGSKTTGSRVTGTPRSATLPRAAQTRPLASRLNKIFISFVVVI